MKKIFLATFALLLVGSAAMAQERSGKAAAISQEKKAAIKKTAAQGKTQSPAANASENGSARKPVAVAASASLAEAKAAKAN